MKVKNKFFWLAAIISLMIDRITKYLIVQKLAYLQSIPLLPGVFHITYITNPGAAWGLFKNEAWLRWLSLIISLALILWAFLGPFFHTWEQLGYGFILGGAMGNGIDRFVEGEVVDFLHFKLINFPIFNFADVFINVGIVCLFIAYIRQETQDSSK